MNVKNNVVPRNLAYLHGFASSPLAVKAVHLERWFRYTFNIPLDRIDLNIPSFREQTLSKIIEHLDTKLHTSRTSWSFVASSFGGLASMILAQRRPDQVHSIVLLAPAFDPVRIWKSNMNIDQWKRDGYLNHYNSVSKREEPVNYEFFDDLTMHPAYPIVRSCPITIVHGRDDLVVPIESSREYCRKLVEPSRFPTRLIEVDDDHHLAKAKTLQIIEKAIRETFLLEKNA